MYHIAGQTGLSPSVVYSDLQILASMDVIKTVKGKRTFYEPTPESIQEATEVLNSE